MPEFRGNDYSTQVTIVNRVTLRYSPVIGLPTIVGFILLSLGVFLAIILEIIVSAIFKIPSRNLTETQFLIFIITYLFSAVSVSFCLKKLYNHLFNKEVSLMEDNGTFILKIGKRQMTFKKNEIRHVRVFRNFGTSRFIAEGHMIIKLKNETIRLATDNYSVFVRMKQYLG